MINSAAAHPVQARANLRSCSFEWWCRSGCPELEPLAGHYQWHAGMLTHPFAFVKDLHGRRGQQRKRGAVGAPADDAGRCAGQDAPVICSALLRCTAVRCSALSCSTNAPLNAPSCNAPPACRSEALCCHPNSSAWLRRGTGTARARFISGVTCLMELVYVRLIAVFCSTLSGMQHALQSACCVTVS